MGNILRATFHQIFQAKSVMEKRKQHLHSSMRLSRNTRRSSSTNNLGRHKQSNSSDFQTQYSDSAWSFPKHHHKLDAQSSSPHICFEESTSIDCHCSLNGSLQTEDETKVQMSECSNHLDCTTNKNKESLPGCLDIGVIGKGS